MSFNDPRNKYYKTTSDKPGQTKPNNSNTYWVKSDGAKPLNILPEGRRERSRSGPKPEPFPKAHQPALNQQRSTQGNPHDQQRSSHPNSGAPQQQPNSGSGPHKPNQNHNHRNNNNRHSAHNKDGPNKDPKYTRPAFSKLRQNLHEFYSNYFAAHDYEDLLLGELRPLTEWIRDYEKKPEGKADLCFYMKPFVVTEVCDSVHDKHFGKWGSFPDRWQKLLEEIEEVGAHPVFRIGVLNSIKKFKAEFGKEKANLEDLNRKLHKIGQRGWYSIPADQLENYLDCFSVFPIDRPEDQKFIREECDRLWKSRRNVDLAIMIGCFDLYSFYDCRIIVEDLVRADRVQEAIRFVDKDKTLASAAIKAMNPGAHSKEARDLIRKFDFDPKSFPRIYERQASAAIRSLVIRLGWEAAEEKLMSESKELLAIFVKILWDQKLYNEALSVQQRYQVQMKRELIQPKNMPPLALVTNQLLSKDQFGPTEVYLNGKPAEEYLTLADFGVKESDVKFLDKIDETFHLVANKLLQAKAVGVDSEFCGDLVGYELSTVATLQLASNDTVAIIDFMKIQNEPAVYEFCKKLFEDPNIQKIGHTFSSDVGVLRASFKNKPMDFVNVINIDEAFVVKNQKLGLAKIVKEVFKKELCKINQQSNWKKRPLRKSQLHYAALDAVSVLHLLQKSLEEKDPRVEGIEPETYSQSAASSESNSKLPLMVNEKAIKAKIAAKKGFKFLVDGMLKKLALNMRNLNLDTTIVPEGSHMPDTFKLAAQEDRIILTRAKKLVLGSRDTPLIRIASTNPFAQMQQLMSTLQLTFTKDDLLKRCAKCNISPLSAISKEEANEVMKWDNPDTIDAKEFWQCAGCKQIYWEGGNFENGQSTKMLELLMRDRALLAAVEEEQQEPTEGAEVEDNSQGGNIEEMMA